METKLYQEQPEQAGGGLDLAPTVEQRVKMVRERILGAISAHGLSLGCAAFIGRNCACALGALALSFGMQGSDIRTRLDVVRCVDSLLDRDEALALEAGFMGWLQEGLTSQPVDRSDPFYALGYELRLKAGLPGTLRRW